jgi:hypothetical protein
MEPTALNSATTDYEGLELVVEWLQAHPDSHNDRFEGTPQALKNDTGYAGSNRVADWPHELISPAGTFSDSRNEDDTLANNLVAAADSAASPRQRLPPNTNLDQNGRFICTYEGCGKTFADILRHEDKHKPARFHCEQCDYSTWRKDLLRSHHDRRHAQKKDLLIIKCQECNYETYHQHDLRRHQAKHTADFQCEQCNYRTWRRDILRRHHDRRHNPNLDRLKCQNCDFETCHKADLQKHQERWHVKGTTDTTLEDNEG